MNRTGRFLQLLVVASLILSACAGAAAEPTVLAEPAEPFIPVISATGKVVPRRWATLSLPIAGSVTSLTVAEGDAVAAGAILLQLSGREQLEAVLQAARLEEIVARQELEQVYDQADLHRAQVQSELASARDELRKAEYDRTVQQEGNRASEDTIKRARANVVLAQDRVDAAKDIYDSTPGSSSSDPGKAQAQAAYLSAKAALDAARRSLNWYTGHPTEIQQAMLDADVAMAEARVALAELAWSQVQDGPDDDVLELAQARLRQAQAAVRAAEAAVRDSELRAPFGGTIGVVEVRPMEWVAPGQPLIDIADLSGLQVETTDLSEIDVARVRPGAVAIITFDALPDVTVEGRVERISPKASPGSGVNYTVWIGLQNVPEGLLWGMTAFVDIQVAD